MPTLIAPGDIVIGSLRNFRRNITAYGEFALWFALLAVASWAFDRVSQAVIADKAIRLFAYLLFAAPVGLIAMALTVALISFTARSLKSRNASVRDSLYDGMHKLLPVLWVTVIATVAVSGGFALLVIPGFIFYIWFRFASYAAVVDDQHGTAALGMSRRAVKGRFWPVVGRVLLSWLVLTLLTYLAKRIIFLVVGAAIGDPGAFFNPSVDLSASSDVLALILAVVPRAIDAMALPLFVAADLMLWYDLKRTS